MLERVSPVPEARPTTALRVALLIAHEVFEPTQTRPKRLAPHGLTPVAAWACAGGTNADVAATGVAGRGAGGVVFFRSSGGAPGLSFPLVSPINFRWRSARAPPTDL